MTNAEIVKKNPAITEVVLSIFAHGETFIAARTHKGDFATFRVDADNNSHHGHYDIKEKHLAEMDATKRAGCA